MKVILHLAAKVLGITLIVIAILQWITFDYPDVNPFWPGAIFAPGMASQVLNWLLVCILGSAGWGLFTLGKFKLEDSTSSE